MTKPIKPEEIANAKVTYLPDAVIEVFNSLIAKHWNGGSAQVKQNEAITLIAERMNLERHEIFARKYLDVEDVYRANGWSVKYDKPGWDESYEAFFVFEPNR